MSNRLERDADYTWNIDKARERNLKALRRNPASPDTLKKIKNFSLKSGLPIEVILEQVMNSDVAAFIFCKDPQKQSIHEKTAANFIKDNKHVVKFEKLPASGANSLFLHEGEIITKKRHDELKLTSKSLDFYWEVKVNSETLKFYATHKYTNEGGGAQDHQYNEIISFLKNANQVKTPNVFFLAISDGDYYSKPYKDTTKLQYLKDNFTGKRTEAIAIKELDGLIDREIFKLKMLPTPFLENKEPVDIEQKETTNKKKSIKVK